MFRHSHHSQHGFGGPGRFHGRGLGGHHGRGGGRFWRHGRRVFDQGDLRLIVLMRLAEKPSHGYEIIKSIEESLGGAYAPSPGVIYPTLQMLEELGHVALAAEEGGKKLYAVTDAGKAYLADNADAVAGVEKRIARAREIFGAGPPPQIVRAMENVRLALRLRLERGALSDARAAEIAAALDAAAAEIERP
ncbi:MAG: PadR family transcriptional regulator [Hyphomonadaceae bacterium]